MLLSLRQQSSRFGCKGKITFVSVFVHSSVCLPFIYSVLFLIQKIVFCKCSIRYISSLGIFRYLWQYNMDSLPPISNDAMLAENYFDVTDAKQDIESSHEIIKKLSNKSHLSKVMSVNKNDSVYLFQSILRCCFWLHRQVRILCT